jgi:hypothetical protein
MTAFWAMMIKPFLLLLVVGLLAVGLALTRSLPESWVRRLLLRRLW